MELLAHITMNEFASFAGIFLLGVGFGLASAWALIGRRTGQDS